MAWLSVFIGGGLGSLCRYGLSKAFPYTSGFPLATFIANVLACLVLGYLIGIEMKKDMGMTSKLLLMTGFCGGFSTFSTFSGESFKLIESGHSTMAIMYMGLSLLICLFGIFAGYQLSKYV